MTWSYSGNPATSEKDAVRWYVGDTNEDDPLQSDEEIDYAISITSNTLAAAKTVAESISSRFAILAMDKDVGDLSIKYSQRAQYYQDIAARLGRDATKQAPIYSAGMNVSNKKSFKQNSNLVQPAFEVGMEDFIQDSNPNRGTN